MIKGISGYLLGLVVAFLAGFATPALADSRVAAAVCVQNQLNALGFYKGKPDGRANSATRAALQAYQGANGAISARKFDLDTAVVFCRHIGLRHGDMRRFWPSAKRPYVVITSDTIEPELKTEIARDVAIALSSFKRNYGFELANTVFVAVGQTPREMVDLTGKYHQRNRGDKVKYWTERCATKTNFTGVSYGGMVGLCRNGPVPLGRNLVRGFVRNVVVHEVFHEAQAQLSGEPRRIKGRDSVLDLIGPVWMIEGSAEFVALQTTSGRSAGGLVSVFRKRLRERPELFLLEKTASRSHFSRDVYRGGGLGVARLTSRSGLKSLPRFYDLLGQGLKWEDAFAKSFGVSPKDFYASYARNF